MGYAIREAETLLTRRQWDIHLQRPLLAGVRTRDAIQPNLNAWLDRAHGNVTFHLTQLLSGHGCFGTYLYRIGKVDSAQCEHCEERREDSAEHTLQECNAWRQNRDALTGVIGNDLNLKTVVRAMCESKEAWSAMSRFAAEVMRTKEEKERERQAREALAESPSSNREDSPE